MDTDLVLRLALMIAMCVDLLTMFRQPALPFFIGLPFMLLYSTYRLYVVYSTPLAISSVFHIDLNVKPKDYDQVKPAIENKTLGVSTLPIERSIASMRLMCSLSSKKYSR